MSLAFAASAVLAESSEFVETITSAKSLGAAAGIVVVVVAYLFLTRRTPSSDLVAHEQTKRHMVDALVRIAQGESQPPKDGEPK